MSPGSANPSRNKNFRRPSPSTRVIGRPRRAPTVGVVSNASPLPASVEHIALNSPLTFRSGFGMTWSLSRSGTVRIRTPRQL